MRYLDPKADLTFKHVFGEHPDLVISLLNALLPLNPRHEIREIEYLPAELVPEILYARTVSWTSAAAMQKDVSLSSRCK